MEQHPPRDRRPDLNRLRAMWAEGRCAVGAIATIPSVQVVQVLAASGLDFLLIDMEHARTRPGPRPPAQSWKARRKAAARPRAV